METKLVKLGDIISLNYGKSLTKKNRIPGNVPVYGSSGITDYHDKPLVDAPSLIIGRKGSIGSVFLSEVPFYPIDTTYFAKESDLNGLDLHFAYYFLKFLPLSEMNTDSAVPGLNRNNFYSLDVVIPDIKSQKIIAFFLDQISYKIKINQQINKNLQKLKDDIWISQRVDKKTSLSNLMTIQSGKRPIDRYDNKFRLKELYPIIGANGVMGWTSKALTAGTIITTGRVGTHGVVNMFDEPVWVSDNSFVISSKYEEVAYEILRCDVKFLTLVHGTTQPLITQKDLKQYVVSIPSNNQLEKVNEHLKVYTNLINVNNNQNKFLTALRNLLLPKLLSGEIDLSDVKEVIQGD